MSRPSAADPYRVLVIGGDGFFGRRLTASSVAGWSSGSAPSAPAA
jgi:hypothetical protein